MPEPTRISLDGVNYVFGADGFPESITLDGFNGTVIPAAGRNFSRIKIRMSDGRKLVPYCIDEPLQTTDERALVLEYPEILWKDEAGNEITNFRLSLRYELMSRGRAFVNAFFVANDMHSPDLDDFALHFEFETADSVETKWALTPRPKIFDATMIQSMRSGRGLEPGAGTHVEKEIIPLVSANIRKANGQTAYFETFVEGENYISGDLGDCATDVTWLENGNLHTTYDFIRERPCKNKLMQLWQWRNQWGWVLKTADRVRHKPPFHMHHYFDNYVRYPSDDCLENLARSGTDVLVLHENWRQDLQNDGTPHNVKELKRVVAKAHDLGMRVALYIRGSEISSAEGACSWFDRYLKKDWDGLYMDYGGPFHNSEPDEAFPGGRLPFKGYLLRMESLRKRIGKGGIFFGHTGLSFSAIAYGAGIIDGFVSGEGEGGVMVRSRAHHEYFSMATATTGTMWTGAFPAYSTGKMRPFLAATGQYPHSPLGEQFKTCSLAHPREPGVNDIAFKPIWKIWRFFRNETDISVLNDYNSSDVFSAAPDTGHYLMVSADKKRALFIVSNFAETEQSFTATLNPALCGFDPAGMKAYRLTPTETEPGKAVPVDAGTLSFDFTLGKWDVGAIYFETEDSGLIAEFEAPYAPLSADNLNYLAYREEQRKLRYEPVPAKEVWMSLTVPNTNLSYEYSLAYDLYYNAMALFEIMEDGTKKRLGWVSQKGFVAEEPPPEDYIWPDVISPRIPLHEILGPGEHFIGIESVHYGGPFYSFLSAELTDTADGANPRTVYFLNELEPEREFLRWKVNII